MSQTYTPRPWSGHCDTSMPASRRGSTATLIRHVLRPQVGSCHFAPSSSEPPEETRTACNAPYWLHPCCMDSPNRESASLRPPEKPEQVPPHKMARHSGFEQLAFGSGGGGSTSARVGCPLRALPEERAIRPRAIMEREFPEAQVVGYEHIIDDMPNDPKDRHVVAAAVKAGAQVITTANLKDFAALPDGVEAQSPDEVLCKLFALGSIGLSRLGIL